MKKWMSYNQFIVILMIIWILLHGRLNIQILFTGLFVSFFVTYFSYEVLLDRKGNHFKGIPLYKLVIYFFSLFIEIFKSAITFSVNVFKKEYVPVVFKISLEHLDSVRVAIVANSITLTPGTISIEMVDQAIYVMVLAKPDTPREALEKPIREKFEKLLDMEQTS